MKVKVFAKPECAFQDRKMTDSLIFDPPVGEMSPYNCLSCASRVSEFREKRFTHKIFMKSLYGVCGALAGKEK